MISYAKLRSRAGGEYEMSCNRLLFSSIFIAAFLSSSGARASSALTAMAIYLACALVILLHLSTRPAVSTPRRLAAVLTDTAILSWQLHVGDETASMFFPIYLWITFGNGFRFGLDWLRIAMLSTTSGFAAVLLTTRFWLAHVHLACGLLVGLVILPLYAGTLIRRLSQARLEAEQANAAKTLFFASVSHELRTPLTAIIGMNDMLRDTRLDAEQSDMVGTVGFAATTLLALIDSILDLSRMEAQRMPAVPVEFHLPAFLDEVLSLVAVQAKAKNIDLKLHLTPRTPISVVASRAHLLEILINLLGNAVKFTAEGGVLLAVDAEPASSGRTRLTLEVIDTGVGIAPEALGRIFDAFTQADPTIQGTYGGTGLGLANAKRRVELLDGDITVRSTPRAGTCFTVSLELELGRETPDPGGRIMLFATDPYLRERWCERLTALGIEVDGPEHADARPHVNTPLLVVRGAPAADEIPTVLGRARANAGQKVILVDEAAAESRIRWLVTMVLSPDADQPTLARAFSMVRARQADQHLVAVETKVAGSGRRILLADDNRTNQQVIGKVLERAGYDVVIVADGEAALDRLGDFSDAFDLVLMDVNMPMLDGLEATQLYRAMALGRPHVPIIALTADATTEMAKRCREAGMDCCVTKPIQPAHLVDLVAGLTRRPGIASSPDLVVEQAQPLDETSAADVLDLRQVDNLVRLGGASFLREVSEGFLSEADAIVEELTLAASVADLGTFRDRAHALRSSSGNVGASVLSDLSASWQHISMGDLRNRGPEIATRARAELARTQTALRSASAEPVG